MSISLKTGAPPASAGRAPLRATQAGGRRPGERHPDAFRRRPPLVQPGHVAGRQVLAGGQHPGIVHDIGQLAVRTGEPQHQ